MKGSEVSDAVSALKTVLGDREYNGRRGHYNFYIKQILDMYSQQGLAEEEDKMDSRFKKTEWMPLMDAIKILKHYGATTEEYMGHEIFPYYDIEGNRKYLEDITWNADNSKNVRVSLVNQAVRELKAQKQGVAEESKGLWANIHAKRERIKQGSGERMRKPGSDGAPTASALRKSAK
jgi:hypothetical protein